MTSNSRLVYSTAGNNLCNKCGKALAKCKCQKTQRPPNSGDGIVRLSRETKGRKGKGVTLISGLDLNEKELKALAKKLKALCGSGGTVRDQVIEIQGDHRVTLKSALEKSYIVKLAGG
ncbi:MAG: stress response translation initiation inhibitor YciH [Pseudohongiellaceae bacterium]